MRPGAARRERVPPTVVEVAKPNGEGVRRLVRLDPADAVEYSRAVAPLVPRIEASLDPGVTANRALARGAVIRLEPWRRALGRHRSMLRRLEARAAETGGPIVRADIRECYGSIGPDALARTLLELGGHPSVVGRLLDLLERLRPPGVTGLPIGPDASAVLANAVLGRADLAVRRVGGRPLRWVDDVAIRARDRPAAERILGALGEALDRLGLAVHPRKSGILEAPRHEPLYRLSPIWSPNGALL